MGAVVGLSAFVFRQAACGARVAPSLDARAGNVVYWEGLSEWGEEKASVLCYFGR